MRQWLSNDLLNHDDIFPILALGSRSVNHIGQHEGHLEPFTHQLNKELLTSSQLTEHLLLEIFGFLVCESILARCQIA